MPRKDATTRAAHARLIAMAPDLLDICRRLTRYAEAADDEGTDPLHIEARELIAIIDGKPKDAE